MYTDNVDSSKDAMTCYTVSRKELYDSKSVINGRGMHAEPSFDYLEYGEVYTNEHNIALIVLGLRRKETEDVLLCTQWPGIMVELRKEDCVGLCYCCTLDDIELKWERNDTLCYNGLNISNFDLKEGDIITDYTNEVYQLLETPKYFGAPLKVGPLDQWNQVFEKQITTMRRKYFWNGRFLSTKLGCLTIFSQL